MEKIWLSSYPKGVPAEIDPDSYRSILGVLDESFAKYAGRPAYYCMGGKLTFADVTVDPTTGTFLLRVLAPNPDHLLLPGMYVRAVFSIGTREDGVLVPQQAIARDPKGHTTALVVGKDGKVELRQVQVSRTVGDKWLVDSGLGAGDRVIVEGLQKVRPGSPVQATEAQG